MVTDLTSQVFFKFIYSLSECLTVPNVLNLQNANGHIHVSKLYIYAYHIDT